MNLNTEIWEGWTLGDLFEENLPIMDQLYNNARQAKYGGFMYSAEPMDTISDIKALLKDYMTPASCARASVINELAKLFAERYGITRR